MAYVVTFTFILNPDSFDKFTETREFKTKRQAWDYIKALDKRSRAKLSEWSEADLVLCPFVPGSQPLKEVFVHHDGKQVFGWGCPSIGECELAFFGRIHIDSYFVTETK